MPSLKAPTPGSSGWSSQLLLECTDLGVSYTFLQMGPTEDTTSIIKSWPENSSGARDSAQAEKPPPHLSLPEHCWRAGVPDLLILWFIPPLAYLLCSQHHARHLAYVTSSPLHSTSRRHYPHFTGEETKVEESKATSPKLCD